MLNTKQQHLPELFAWLVERGSFEKSQILATSDGFCLTLTTIADILAQAGISTVPGRQGNTLDCKLFFDDWHIYAISDGTHSTYSLFKMREQEHDAKSGQHTDGDTPGVTISFIAMQTEILQACLQDPTPANRIRLNEEMNRVVAYGGQRHSQRLKEYFIRTEAQGPYQIAALYTEYIASLAKNGCIPVPECYACDCKKQGARGRVARFLEENNANANAVICDHEHIYIANPLCPTKWERLAILATHTGNTSYYSFAAEVQFHARFLTPWVRLPLPIIGRSFYASAIRADMSIGDTEFAGPTPYYRPNSRIVQQQYLSHKDNLEGEHVL